MIHKTYTRHVWHQRGWWARMALAARFLLWPWGNLGLIAFYILTNGVFVRRRTGKGLVRQAFEQAQLCLVHSVPPINYYTFELHDDEKRKKASQYLHRYETKGGIYKLLPGYGSPVDHEVLKNKARFVAKCEELGIHTIPVLAVLECGQARTVEGEVAILPHMDIFVKPATGKGGKGARWWEYLGDGRFKGSDGTELAAPALMAHLLILSRKRAYVVQPRARNHAEIADLSNGALTTARIMTCRDERGGIEVTNAVFRMAVGSNTLVDNFHAGGIAAKIDIHTGQLGRATDRGLHSDRGWCDVHPDSHAPITGRILPRWQEALELVCRAHTLLSERILMGWDVAFLKEGPCLVEGNRGPDLDIIQRTHREPLGNARVGELLVVHLQATRGSDLVSVTM